MRKNDLPSEILNLFRFEGSSQLGKAIGIRDGNFFGCTLCSGFRAAAESAD